MSIDNSGNNKEALIGAETLSDNCVRKINKGESYMIVQNYAIDSFEYSDEENAENYTIKVIARNTEGKIVVSGKTNLFDGAQLMISIIPDGKFYGPSCKVNCLNGTFTSEPLGNGKNLLGKCKMSITMPVSSAQPIEFVKKAGMQYENLKGDFIVRKGISPSGKYEQEVVL